MTKKKHLSLENREVIAQGIPAGDSAGRIARRIDVSTSTVTREVKANRTIREKKSTGKANPLFAVLTIKIARKAAVLARNVPRGSRPASTARRASALLPVLTLSARCAPIPSAGPMCARKNVRSAPTAAFLSAATTLKRQMQITGCVWRPRARVST